LNYVVQHGILHGPLDSVLVAKFFNVRYVIISVSNLLITFAI